MKSKLLLLGIAALIFAAQSVEANHKKKRNKGVIFLPQVRPVGPFVPIVPGTNPFVPVAPTYPWINPGYNPGYIAPPIITTPGRNRRALERAIEQNIEARFGPRIVRRANVDIERDGDVEIEVKLRDRRFRQAVVAYIYSIPQLRGLRLDIDIDD